MASAPNGSPAPDPIPPTLEWTGKAIRLIDQRLLPTELRFLDVSRVDELCGAIRDMAVRGAPALGVAGAMGVALASVTGEALEDAAARLIATRPTAVNLAWGVRRALASDDPVAEALHIAADDLQRNRRMGRNGSQLIAKGARVYTHCNAGALACSGWGTALGVVRAAVEEGKEPRAWVGETRPLLQGARLTAWELDRLGVRATVVADVMAATLMASGEVDCILVGADRIAANGDVANKVGTYGLAVLAAHHRVPIYTVAPVSTIDFDCADGRAIPIERRSADEVTTIAGTRIAPAGVGAENRAFDVTPAALVTAIVTEEGIARPPYETSLSRLAGG